MPTQRQGYAGGGRVEPLGYAGGGEALGDDTIPAMLAPGEFVVSRPAVREIGLGNLLAMNAKGGGTNRPRKIAGRMYAKGGGVAAKKFQGSNNNFLVDLASDYQKKLDEANAANEERYGQILEGYSGLRDRVLGGMENLGQSQLTEAKRMYDQSLAGTTADMAGRGLSGTTVGASIRQGTDRGYQDAVQGIQEATQARRASADAELTAAKLGAIERREDTGPDFSNLMLMTQGMAAGGYGQGYGGGYGGGSDSGPAPVFSMRDYFGQSAFSPYESVAAGMLGHAPSKDQPYLQTSPTGR
jgi:hypothetical protein